MPWVLLQLRHRPIGFLERKPIRTFTQRLEPVRLQQRRAGESPDACRAARLPHLQCTALNRDIGELEGAAHTHTPDSSLTARHRDPRSVRKGLFQRPSIRGLPLLIPLSHNQPVLPALPLSLPGLLS